MLSDPRLIDRLTWREGIRPQTMVSRDRGLMARTFGTMYAFAALVGVTIVLFGERGNRDQSVLILLTAITAAFSTSFFVFYGRLPGWFFQVGLAFGSLLIAGATIAGSTGAEGVNALWCVWVVVLAFLFLSTRGAVAQTTFAIGAYATALLIEDIPFKANFILVMAVVLGTSGAVIGLLRSQLEQIASSLASDAQTDATTAIANRRGFNERFALEFARADRHERPLSLLICDLDRFKAVNDALGHAEGDAALRRAAGAISSSVRAIDMVARMGGEEFSVLLPDADRMEAYVVAERVRHGVLDAFADFAVPVTASCGVATFDAHRAQSPGDLMGAADAALYRAKDAGRNCTVAADTEDQMRLDSPTK